MEHVIEISTKRQRHFPPFLTRLTGPEVEFLGRLQHYENTGRHACSAPVDAHELWPSVLDTPGASAKLVQILDSTFETWSTLVASDRVDFDRVAAARLDVGDVFRIHPDSASRSDSFFDLFGFGIDLPLHLQDKLLRIYLGFSFLEAYDARRLVQINKVVEVLINYRPQVTAVLSEPRLWRADGKINAKKAIKILSDDISSVLGELAEYELNPLAQLWRNTETRSTTKSTTEHGLAFEDAVAEFFKACGFEVARTAISGDYGVDLIVADDRVRIAVQVKNLAGPVGVAAVQQVVAGAQHYGCTYRLVVANNGFTDAAHTLAASTKTSLYTLHLLREHLHTTLGDLLTVR